MIPELDQLDAIVGRKVDRPNALAVIAGLEAFPAGIDAPQRLAQYLAQLLHESAAFRYDGEIWGPTTAQRGYEGRHDLGNDQPGDGFFFKGRTAIQVTGRRNYREFRNWCAAHGLNPPDFEISPTLVNGDPWEGLAPIWYWDTHRLNSYADDGNNEMVTRRINGGLNGYPERLTWYVKTALVLLGYDRADVIGFQHDHKLTADGIPGPKTRAAMHEALKAV